jgi:hypothetical protein
MSMTGRRLIAVYRDDIKLDMTRDTVFLANCMNCGPVCLINGQRLQDGERLYFETQQADDKDAETDMHLVYVEHDLFGTVPERLAAYNRQKFNSVHHIDFRAEF